MGKIISKDKLNDSFCHSTKFGGFHNNSASEVFESYDENNILDSNFNLRKNMQNRVQLSKSKLSWKKDLSDCSYNNSYINRFDDVDKDECGTILSFTEKDEKVNIKPFIKSTTSNEDHMFNIVPVTLEIDNVYRSIVVKPGHSIDIPSSAIQGSQIEVRKIFNENNKNKLLLNDIENTFLLLRIEQENLNKLPFIINNDKSNEMKNLIPNVSDQTNSYKESSILKLGFSKIDSGRFRYLMFLRASASHGWKNVSIFHQYARTLIANERKTGCDIHISETLLLYRGSEVKPLIIEGNDKRQIIRCKSLLPKFIQQHLICDVQNIETENFQIK